MEEVVELRADLQVRGSGRARCRSRREAAEGAGGTEYRKCFLDGRSDLQVRRRGRGRPTRG